MPSITFSAYCMLEDGTPLLSVVETTRERRWWRTVERSRTVTYVARGGAWWGEGLERVTDPAMALRLAELAMQQVIRRSLDEALE